MGQLWVLIKPFWLITDSILRVIPLAMIAISLIALCVVSAWPSVSSETKLKWWTKFDLNGFKFYKRIQSTFTCKELYKLETEGKLPSSELDAVRRGRLMLQCEPREILLPVKMGTALLISGILLQLFTPVYPAIYILLDVVGLGFILVPSFRYLGKGIEAMKTLVKK